MSKLVLKCIVQPGKKKLFLTILFFCEKKLLILSKTKSLQMVTTAMKLKDTCSLEEKL